MMVACFMPNDKTCVVGLSWNAAAVTTHAHILVQAVRQYRASCAVAREVARHMAGKARGSLVHTTCTAVREAMGATIDGLCVTLRQHYWLYRYYTASCWSLRSLFELLALGTHHGAQGWTVPRVKGDDTMSRA